jgi:uncharacterized NAD(P)/FAD-binding protein YdhS/predicted metal-dependent enzyme (double-stranded beta helix superfamily)
MESLSSRLQSVVDQLDDLGSDTSLAGIARVLSDAALTAEDVAPFVRPTPSSYARVRVVRNERYELLVLTWLPGQASPPHDHTGSVCVLQVIEGTAIEAEFSVASDGYADLEYESGVATGEVSGGQDAGVHTVRNPSPSERLVTVHVYAPPLRDVRRYTPRPVPTPRRVEPRVPTVVILGGGFCGAMTAANLLRHGSDLRVVLIERRGTVGEGLAYGTLDSDHLLNVPAGRMSAWPDRPDDFFEWAKRRQPDVRPGDFLPRMGYGEYLRETLHRTAGESHAKLDVFLEEARRVARHPSGGWMVHLERGAPIRADEVVLAVGHRPPSDPLRRLWTGPRSRFLPDPWQPFDVRAIPPDESVAILGSGLTAIDTVLSLTKSPRSAPITLISRNGFLPHSHARAALTPCDLTAFVEEWLADPAARTAVALARAIHRRARRNLAEGGDWRAVVDGLRPHTARLWQAMTDRERSKFIARLRPFWEVHRHRMAPRIAETIDQLRRNGSVLLQPGSVVAADASPAGVRIDVRPRGGDRPLSGTYHWVVNCTGPAPSNRPEASPVIGSLLVHGWVRRDRLSLGLDVNADGQTIAANGSITPDLSVVGTLRKPLVWESTAVPELRQQAALVAARILRRFPCDTCI